MIDARACSSDVKNCCCRGHGGLLNFGRFSYRELVEHSCFRCGAGVGDGTSFCASCGAPQIRVAAKPAVEAEEASPGPEPTSQQAGASNPPAIGSAGEAQPAAARAVGAAPDQLDWTKGLPSAALGGVCGAVLSLLPLVSLLLPLWMAATGAFAVGFYRRRKPASLITAGLGARLGALAGSIAFVPFAVVMALEFLFMARTGMMKEVFSRMSTTNADPQVQEQLQQIAVWLQSPQGAAVAVVAALAFCFLGFVLLATIGGAIWASTTGKRVPN